MPEFLYNEMKDYMDRIYGLGEDDRIFYFGKGAIKYEIDRISELAQEESIRTHDLRHSHVALLIELGYRTHAIAKRIGDTPEEVDKTYAHLYPNKDQAIAVELNRHRDGIIHQNQSTDDGGLAYSDREIAELLELRISS